MINTMTGQHTWVKHTITPVSALIDDDGTPVVFVDPDDQAISEDHAVYGCDVCGVVMDGHIGSKCEGEPYDD